MPRAGFKGPDVTTLDADARPLTTEGVVTGVLMTRPEVPEVDRSAAEREIGASAAVAPRPPGTGELAPGVVTPLSSRVRRVIARNPSLMTGPGTGTYLVGVAGGDLAVIDPGPDDDAHLDRIAEVGDGRIRWILVTHTHQDHSPGAPGLQARTGAPMVGFGPRDGFVPDVTAGDGWVLRVDGPVTLRALHTPGHASNHLCWLLEEEGLLFSGDHVMDGSTVVIAPPDGDMSAYLAQLGRLRRLGLAAIAPGHGKLITDPDGRLDEYLAHRDQREREVLAALDEGPRTVEDLVAAIYQEVTAALHPVAKYSVWAHLRKLAAEGRASAGDPDDVATTWAIPPEVGEEGLASK
jgi:glyoxylase-like metal-dependent hydrolase (beta-lactamase superfamily II)